MERIVGNRTQLARDLLKAYIATPQCCFSDSETRTDRPGNDDEPFSRLVRIRKELDAQREVVVSAYDSNGPDVRDLQVAIRNGTDAHLFRLSLANQLDDLPLSKVMERAIRIFNAFQGACEAQFYASPLSIAIKSELGVCQQTPVTVSSISVPSELRRTLND